METMAWNVKNAETVSEAVNNMRYGVDCSISPLCVTKCRSFGQTIEARRKLQSAIEEIKPLAADDYYREHGLDDYRAACEKLFSISKRRGYVLLTLN